VSWTLLFLLLTILVFWALGAHNRLVRLRAQVGKSLQALVQLWHAQGAALDAHLQDYAQGRETASQWAALDDDALRWRPLSQAARQFLSCLAVLSQRAGSIAQVDDISSVRAARSILEEAWLRLKSEQEDLAGNPVPPNLLLLWSQHESAAALKLAEYDEAVQAYHTAIAQFPALLLAWLFGFGMTGKLS
jgi:LemA protein